MIEYYISLKEMLSGLKKSKAKEEGNTIRSQVNQNRMKAQQILQEQSPEQNIEKKIENQQHDQQKRLYTECLDMYLSGKTNQLYQRLTNIKNLKQEATKLKQVRAKQQKGNKFDYNIDFDEQEEKNIKKEIRKRNRPIMASNRMQQYCVYCPDNEDLYLLSASNYVYLAFAKFKTFQQMFHFILAPVDHQQTSIGLNEDVLTELSNYKKCLIQAFDKYDVQVVFFEQFSKDNSHIYIQCLAVPRRKAQDLPFFFKQTLQDIEGNWTTHKNVIKIQKDKGGIQKQIPKPIKYFYIDFSNGYGYAHVIENERFWKRQFCYEVLATALNMEMHKVKTTQTYSIEQLDAKRVNFEKIWKPFDWTQLI